MIQGCCGDERIAHLQAVAQGATFHQLDGPQRDGFGDWQQGSRTVLQHLLHRNEFGNGTNTTSPKLNLEVDREEVAIDHIRS